MNVQEIVKESQSFIPFDLCVCARETRYSSIHSFCVVFAALEAWLYNNSFNFLPLFSINWPWSTPRASDCTNCGVDSGVGTRMKRMWIFPDDCNVSRRNQRPSQFCRLPTAQWTTKYHKRVFLYCVYKRMFQTK